MQNLSNDKSPSRRRPLLPLQREDVPGCKQVPLEYTRGVIRWAHPDGYFLNAQGQKIAHDYGPAKRNNPNTMGGDYPRLRSCRSRTCHSLMAAAFYGTRPDEAEIGVTKKSSSYFCHHLIPDRLDYRPANLLCWLTRAEHSEADRRQRALRVVLPDMHAISYEKHRFLQDPRTTCREVFDVELQKLRQQFK